MPRETTRAELRGTATQWLADLVMGSLATSTTRLPRSPYVSRYSPSSAEDENDQLGRSHNFFFLFLSTRRQTEDWLLATATVDGVPQPECQMRQHRSDCSDIPHEMHAIRSSPLSVPAMLVSRPVAGVTTLLALGPPPAVGELQLCCVPPFTSETRRKVEPGARRNRQLLRIHKSTSNLNALQLELAVRSTPSQRRTCEEPMSFAA